MTHLNGTMCRREERGEQVSLLFNEDSDKDKRDETTEFILKEGQTHNLFITRLGTYRLIPDETDNTLSLEFHEQDR